MTSVIPAVTGLTIDGVIYQYTAVKNAEDPMTVSVQNKNAQGTDYIFRSVDDWNSRPGNSITKVVPVDNIPIRYWGNGEIAVSGKGEVKDQSVMYKYRYDSCIDPLSSPSCPGYAEAMLKNMKLEYVETIDPLNEEYVKHALEVKIKIDDEKEREKRTEQTADKTKKIEKEIDVKKILNVLLTPSDVDRTARFEMMNNIPGIELYSINIPSGVYKDELRYPDKNLPDNRRGRSLGIAQDRLHKTMVDSQYDR